jgi:hypothetical protein
LQQEHIYKVRSKIPTIVKPGKGEEENASLFRRFSLIAQNPKKGIMAIIKVK